MYFLPIDGVFIVIFWSVLRQSMYFIMLLLICILHCECIEETKITVRHAENRLYRSL